MTSEIDFTQSFGPFRVMRVCGIEARTDKVEVLIFFQDQARPYFTHTDGDVHSSPLSG